MSTLTGEHGARVEASPPARIAPTTRSAAWLRTLWNWLIGSAACFFAPASPLVVGWTYRRVRRGVVLRWRRASGSEAVEADPRPAWFIREAATRTPLNVLSPVFTNFVTGIRGVFNTYVLTLPAGIAWLFAWRFGWDNSFHKVYEQSAIGVSVWMLGNALFIAAMLYVPLAQARQAATGDWRAFYGFRVVWSLLRRRPVRWVMISAAYALVSIPVYALMWAPQFISQSGPIQDMTDAQLVFWLYRYYFLGSLLIFPAYVGLRLLAGRLYATALPPAVQRGEIGIDRLHPFERETLDRLGLLRVEPPARRHVVLRAVGWTGGRCARFATGFAAVLLWFTVAFQVSLSNFIHYSSRRWLVLPMVQLPTITHIPNHLVHPPAIHDATDRNSSLTGL